VTKFVRMESEEDSLPLVADKKKFCRTASCFGEPNVIVALNFYPRCRCYSVKFVNTSLVSYVVMDITIQLPFYTTTSTILMSSNDNAMCRSILVFKGEYVNLVGLKCII